VVQIQALAAIYSEFIWNTVVTFVTEAILAVKMT
jgi:hypothetical protein